MLEYKPLSVEQMKAEGNSLLEEHYQELTLHKDVIKLNVDWKKYSLLEFQDYLMSLGVWQDGILLGYSVFILQNHLHYKDVKIALNDVIFLRSDKRKGSVGIKLIKKSETILKELGVTKVLWHCKPNTVAYELLTRMGYILEEYTVGKII